MSVASDALVMQSLVMSAHLSLSACCCCTCDDDVALPVDGIAGGFVRVGVGSADAGVFQGPVFTQSSCC